GVHLDSQSFPARRSSDLKHYDWMLAEFPDIVQIVCDEPHLYYRGFNSKRTQFFANKIPNRVRVHFLTATPTPRGKLTSAYIYCQDRKSTRLNSSHVKISY